MQGRAGSRGTKRKADLPVIGSTVEMGGRGRVDNTPRDGILLHQVEETMLNINREHPEYIARKAMWRQYKDLYAGGERLRANASEYLVRRHKEPGEVYQERLSRVFYENYIGSIIDWYAATLIRREPGVLFEGSDSTAKEFYNLLSKDCDLKGTKLSEFFRQRFVQMLVCGCSYIVVDFPRTDGAALTRADEDP